MRIRFVFAVLVSLAASNVSFGETVTRKVGTIDINLALPTGFCVLEENNYRDAIFISVIRQLLQGTNKLIAVMADCTQLSRWRGGDNTEITQYSIYYLPNAVETLTFPGDANSLRKGFCNDLRKQGNATLAGAKDLINKRVKEISETASVDKFNFIGVISEDNNGCYAALLLNGTDPMGKSFVMQGIMTGTVVRTKLLFMALYDPYVDSKTIDLGVNRSIAVAAELIKANP